MGDPNLTHPICLMLSVKAEGPKGSELFLQWIASKEDAVCSSALDPNPSIHIPDRNPVPVCCRVQSGTFPVPAGQDAVGLLGHLGTLLAHIQVAVDQHPQILFHQASLQPLFPKPVALHGVLVTQVQDPALGRVEPHTIGLGPSVQSVQIPLQSHPTLKQIRTPAQLGVIFKLTCDGTYDDLFRNLLQHRDQTNRPVVPQLLLPAILVDGHLIR
ncbi:integral membrane protein dgcr2 idd [Limosa lapponica baueri]|uniref:Integral membrane protein dgcr2 idd n=1 Tax=Limosa lapponica baueri TaxID=1758121 RepID=A0A2I0UJZ3_LIMLA|nr:integral membrane protein dgcr2 idd [Limosa lapponica baueri]